MTIKSDGSAISCVEDYNNEIVLGHIDDDSRHDIWNGENYHTFRNDHFDLTSNMKWTKECDMKLVGESL
jgi:radical SAM protein with 4Fe4S-binding SPASM domain